jgi:hypothetical protein
MSDLLRKYKSLYSSTSNSFGTGTGETITPNSVVGLPTDTEITLTFDRVDATGAATDAKMERIIGTISGGNLVVRTSPATGRGADGTTDVAHTSPVVEMVFNAKDWNDSVDWGLVEHQQSGAHKAITSSLVTASNITASQVTSSNMTTRLTHTACTVNASQVTTTGMTATNGVMSAITGTSKFPKVSGMFNAGSSGSAIAINWLNGDRQRVNITASTTMTFTNAADGQILTLLMYENGTGGYSITLPSMTWPASTVSTWTTTACAVNTVTALYDATASKYLAQGTANYG